MNLTREDALVKIREGINEQQQRSKIDITDITEDTVIRDTGIDSLDLVECVMDVEEYLGIEIEQTDVNWDMTIGQFLDHCEFLMNETPEEKKARLKKYYEEHYARRESPPNPETKVED